MGERNWNSFRSKVDLTQNISKTLFVTNFPDHTSARDLWGTCKAYGTVVDVYIPFKKSKAGKRLAFVRFIKVENLDRLVANLSDSFKGNVGNSSKSFASVLKSVNEPTGREVPSLVLDDTCFSDRDFNLAFMGKVLIEMESPIALQKFNKHAGVGSWFSSLQPANNSFVSDERIVWISIEGLPLKVWSHNTFEKVASKWGELVEWKNIKDTNFSRKQLCVKTKLNEIICERFKVIIQGKVHWVRAKEMEGWDPLLRNEDYASSSSDEENEHDNEGSRNEEKYESDKEVDKVSESSCMQGDAPFYDNDNNKKRETPSEEVKQNSYNSVRNSSLNDSYCSQRFKAGGSIIDLMDELVKVRQTMGYNMDGWLGHKTKKGWIKELCTKNRFNFVSLQETKMEHMELVTINMLWGNSSFDYAFSSSLGNLGGILCVWEPTLFHKENSTSSDYFLAVTGTWIPTWDGECVIMGDFNEVRSEQERYGSVFNVQSAAVFNNFISLASLIDLPLDGLMVSFPHLSAIYLDKHLSDHRPILMREMNIDYGPTPFRFFHSWFQLEGFDKLVEDTWMHMNITDSNGMIILKKKLQALKIIIREWTKNAKKCSYKKKSSIQSKLSDIDKIIDQGGSNEEVAQKVKVCWAIEGDENSKYFHGILNNKRSQLTIRGVLVNGDWIVEPKDLSLEQQVDLERTVSKEEIKRAVYWKIFEKDIAVAITEFFSSGTFPKGCNSSFIALIPKTQNAKTVKDFRPISLIGILYKIIAKILANRLSSVIPDLISDVQSAFISDRQILDGPFILNELLSWCKYKNLKAMIFKVDFEKSFDSIRWDYLNDVLKMFGFGDKWRGWIKDCLNSAKGYVLVNGSPTPEFQFHRGLKQGDPLSPFLFILIMESLHLSFKKIMNAGLFTGIPLDNSLTISHLFYADDVIFVGKWNSSYLKIILKVLKCFHMASGLKMNINKSKLMGYGVHS
ncbi:RNA-directed DNA polymerase, eukaryota, partial [Tanacetum coccineum]